MSKLEQFVPVGSHSLSSDAPGWSHVTSSTTKCENNNKNNNNNTERLENKEKKNVGPTCWKCKGTGSRKKYKKQKKSVPTTQQQNETKKEEQREVCSVCNGNGYIPIKQNNTNNNNNNNNNSTYTGGMITSSRRISDKNWKTHGPMADALLQMNQILNSNNQNNISNNIRKQYQLLQKATQTFLTEGVRMQQQQDHDPNDNDDNTTLPWFPSHPNEQLCNLVGTWRILQKKGSHRWTSDDLCTAYIASLKLSLLNSSNHLTPTNNTNSSIHYLDLGCGNASVLQMVSWSLLDEKKKKKKKNYSKIQIFGMEARSEAVQLARRSLSFNIGNTTTNHNNNNNNNDDDDEQPKKSVHIIHCDFRDLIHGKKSSIHPNEKNNNNDDDDDYYFHIAKETKFDLITGTPPYFQVDFNTAIASSAPPPVDNNNNNAIGENDDQPLKHKQTKEDRKVTSAIINQGGMPTSIQSAPARCEFRGGIEAYCEAASTVLKENHGYFCVCENWLNHHRVLQAALSSKLTITDIHPFHGKSTKPQPLFAVYVMQKKQITTTTTMPPQQQQPKMHSPISIRDEFGTWTKEYADVLETMSIPAKYHVNQSPKE